MSGRVLAASKRFLPKYLFALVSSFFLLTAGVFSRRHRFLIFQIAEHFGMRMPTLIQSIPTIPVTAVLDSKLDLTLLEPLGDPGNVTLLELMILCNLSCRAQPPQAFEIGTFDGRTALNIAANLAPAGMVYTLDLPASELTQTKFKLEPGEHLFVEKKKSGAKFAGTEFAPKITQLYGDSAVFDFSPYQGQMGLVFVDGSHTLEYLRHDTETALRLVAPGGIILWHDYQQDWPGVITGLNELYQNNPDLAGLSRIEGTTLVILRLENTRR